jgi:ABC-type transporter Mla subunit MlaD
MNIRFKETLKAGIIIISAFLILSLSVILVGGGQFLQKFDAYYTRVVNAAGIEVGSQVRLGGVRVGKVIDIIAPSGPGESVTIKLGVKKGTTLYKGTKAMITQIGFVGDIYLLLTLDNAKGETFKPGDTIPAEEPIEFGKLIAKLNGISDSLNGLINDIDKIFSQKNIEGIEQLVGNTNKAIVSSSANIEKVASSLKETTEKLNSLLSELEDVVKSNKGEFSGLIKKAHEDLMKAGDMIKAIESAAKSTDRAVELQSRNLDELLKSLTNAAEGLEDVLMEVKNKPWSIIYKEGESKEE